ncbi:hypothetical protein COLO4_32445 [Corchorus olitorius]|uniref:Uncharacterized protein n=1 Tax=Corchorus olitorius TaxID=93759 RepID=A0A1R3GZN5_9ROSI|nr:hypothetical protein COLO4_32445 [Corchorus olitorius]
MGDGQMTQKRCDCEQLAAIACGVCRRNSGV